MRRRPLNLFSNLSILLLIAFSQYAGAQAPQRDDRPHTASIIGQVTIGGQPVANVTVTIVEVDSSAGGEFFGASRATAMKEHETFTAITDAGGRYRLAGLAAGNYKSGRFISWRINGRSKGFEFRALSLTALKSRTA